MPSTDQQSMPGGVKNMAWSWIGLGVMSMVSSLTTLFLHPWLDFERWFAEVIEFMPAFKLLIRLMDHHLPVAAVEISLGALAVWLGWAMLQRRPWSATATEVTAWIFTVLCAAWTLWAGSHWNAMINQLAAESGPGLDLLVLVFKIVGMTIIGVMVLFILAIGWWHSWYLRKPAVKAYFHA